MVAMPGNNGINASKLIVFAQEDHDLMTHLFTYGSLMCADIMERVAGCRLRCIETVLQGFFRSGIQGEEYPGIVPSSGSAVSGVLYLNLPEEALRRLDLFEGDMYERHSVEVVSTEYERLTAMTYVVKACFYDRLTNEQWSYARFLATGKSNFEKMYLGFEKLISS